MKHLQKAPRKLFLNEKQGEVFISLLDDDLYKKIAKSIFVDGMTNDEVAEYYSYSRRQVDRLRVSLMKTVLIRLIEKQIPKKPRETRCALMCANCGHKITEKGCKKLNRFYCKKCGQALDWSDTE